MRSGFSFLLILLAVLMSSCAKETPEAKVRIASLSDAEGLAAIRSDFTRQNPGYDLSWLDPLADQGPSETTGVFFIQSGTGSVSVSGSEETASSEVGCGDVVILRSGESLHCDGTVTALRFDVPAPPENDLPAIIRPDWDENITDTPGGCAEEGDAYRRILLTWQEKNGPYLFHALNAHRVRIRDSFSHYHPLAGGFDEFYLVQGIENGAAILTSERTSLIESPESVTQKQASDLLEKRELQVGELVYLPRGTVHRGLGGVLAQVITMPGFVPGAEIGVDHHLKAINDRLGLEGAAALPFHENAAKAPVIK